MATKIQAEAPKRASKQSKQSKKGNGKSVAKKPAKFTLINTRDAALNTPVGEIVSKFDFASDVVVTDMKAHTPKKGIHEGEKTLQLVLTDNEGKKHALYQEAVLWLGDEFERDALAYLKVIDAARTIRAAQKK